MLIDSIKIFQRFVSSRLVCMVAIAAFGMTGVSYAQTQAAQANDSPCESQTALSSLNLLPAPSFINNVTPNPPVAGKTFQIPGDVTASGGLIYNVPVSKLQPTTGTVQEGQVYTFQVCVETNKGASQGTTAYPFVNVTGDVQNTKTIAYIAQNNKWTVYRTIFYLNSPTSPTGTVRIDVSSPGNTNDAFSTFKNPGLFLGSFASVPGADVPFGQDILQNIGWFSSGAFTPDWGTASVAPSPLPILKDVTGQSPTHPSSIKTINAVQMSHAGDQAITVNNYQTAFKPVSQLESPGIYKLTYWIRPAPGTGTQVSENGLCSQSIPYVAIVDNSNFLSSQQSLLALGSPDQNGWQQCQDSFSFKGGLPNFPEVNIYWYKNSKVTGTYQVTGVAIKQLQTNGVKSPGAVIASQVPLIANFTDSINTTTPSLSDMKIAKANSDGSASAVKVPMWLLPKRTIGSANDEPGVLPYNVEIVQNRAATTDVKIAGKPVLRLRFFGGDDSTKAQNAAGVDTSNPYASERQGAAIVSSPYYASGIFVHCVRLPYSDLNPPVAESNPLIYSRHNTGAVSAFWPYFYQDLPQGAPGANNEGGTIRNSELDWEIPGAYEGDAKDINKPGSANFGNAGYDNARLNVWGGQWSGISNNFSGRPPQPTLPASPASETYLPGSFRALNNGSPLNNGQFVQISYVIDGGGTRNSSGSGERTPGQVAWYFNPKCALLDKMPSDISTDTPAQQRDVLSNLIVGTNFDDMPGAGKLIAKIAELGSKSVLGTRVHLAQSNNPAPAYTSKVNQPSAGIFSGANYGQDNVPFKPMRDWVGLWGPGGNAHVMTSLDKSDPSKIHNFYWGWGGTPDFLYERGVPDFLCVGKETSDPRYKQWMVDNQFSCSSAEKLKRKNYINLLNLKAFKVMPGSSTKEYFGVRYVDTADPARPGYLAYTPSSSAGGKTKAAQLTKCSPTADTSRNCFSNERDEDVASVVILPLKMSYDDPKLSRENPQDLINYQEASSNYVCSTDSDGEVFPFGCNSHQDNGVTGDPEKYPVYNPKD
ncbi:MAG: hypothetical protein P1U40_11055 [Coxiellaceae bacterium]|nr:hypothetical protein [Coxiellaceae bacterium]